MTAGVLLLCATALLSDFPGTVRERLIAAGDWCRSHPGGTLVIPPGEHRLEDARAKDVQRTTFANGVTVTVDFRTERVSRHGGNEEAERRE